MLKRRQTGDVLNADHMPILHRSNDKRHHLSDIRKIENKVGFKYFSLFYIPTTCPNATVPEIFTIFTLTVEPLIAPGT